jgi:hypothetical protein
MSLIEEIISIFRKYCEYYDIDIYDSVYEKEDFFYKGVYSKRPYCAKNSDKTRYLCLSCETHYKLMKYFSKSLILTLLCGVDNISIVKEILKDFSEESAKILSEGIDKLVIFDNLHKDCDYYNWYSIHEYDKESPYAVLEVISADLGYIVRKNYCGVSPMLNRYLCKKCASNYRKIKYYLDKDDIHTLSTNWDSPFDENISLNTMRKLRYKDLNLDPNWKVKYFKYTFNEDLDNYIEELKDYDAISFGDFNKSLLPLKNLLKLKCIIGGIWFFSNINELNGLTNLQLIYVGKLYNIDLEDDIYNKTYVTSVGRAPFSANE